MLEQFCKICAPLKAKFSLKRDRSHNVKSSNQDSGKSAASIKGSIQQATTINNNNYYTSAKTPNESTTPMQIVKEKALDTTTLQSELRLSMLGGNIFIPDNVNEQILTGIALNVRVWNTGAPSFVSSWSLMVIPHGEIPILAQLIRMPELLRVNGMHNNAVIRAIDALDLKVNTTSVGTTPVEGTLLFYVKLSQKIVLDNDTRLELIATDMYEKETRKVQRIGDWLHR